MRVGLAGTHFDVEIVPIITNCTNEGRVYLDHFNVIAHELIFCRLEARCSIRACTLGTLTNLLGLPSGDNETISV